MMIETYYSEGKWFVWLKHSRNELFLTFETYTAATDFLQEFARCHIDKPF